MLFSTKVLCSVALLCKFPQFYTNLRNLPFAMKEKNGIGESKPKQSRRQGESAPELLVGRAYAVEPLAVSKVLIFSNCTDCFPKCLQTIRMYLVDVPTYLRRTHLKEYERGKGIDD